MVIKLHSAGPIRFEPRSLDVARLPCDDSTLELLLASLAYRQSLADDHRSQGPTNRLFAVEQYGLTAGSGVEWPLKANLLQLADDLDAEYARALDGCS